MVALRRPCLSLPSRIFGVSLFLHLFLFISSSIVVDYSKPLKGSTPGLKEIFIGRCYDYFANNKHYGLHPVEVNSVGPSPFCNETWDLFKGAFAGRNICTVVAENYQPYFDKTLVANITNKALLWSGTFGLSSSFSAKGRRLVALADTLTGFLVTNLDWCGDVNSPDGINYENCTRCKKNADDPALEGFEVFWGVASEKFAERIEQEVKLLLTSTGTVSEPRNNLPAFHKGTFFYKYELPKLDKDEVSLVRVILARQPGLQKLPEESCRSGSLAMLEQEINDTDIPNTCEENPPPIRHLLCVDTPAESECIFNINQQQIAQTSYSDMKGFQLT